MLNQTVRNRASHQPQMVHTFSEMSYIHDTGTGKIMYTSTKDLQNLNMNTWFSSLTRTALIDLIK